MRTKQNQSQIHRQKHRGRGCGCGRNHHLYSWCNRVSDVTMMFTLAVMVALTEEWRASPSLAGGGGTCKGSFCVGLQYLFATASSSTPSPTLFHSYVNREERVDLDLDLTWRAGGGGGGAYVNASQHPSSSRGIETMSRSRRKKKKKQKKKKKKKIKRDFEMETKRRQTNRGFASTSTATAAFTRTSASSTRTSRRKEESNLKKKKRKRNVRSTKTNKMARKKKRKNKIVGSSFRSDLNAKLDHNNGNGNGNGNGNENSAVRSGEIDTVFSAAPSNHLHAHSKSASTPLHTKSIAIDKDVDTAINTMTNTNAPKAIHVKSVTTDPTKTDTNTKANGNTNIYANINSNANANSNANMNATRSRSATNFQSASSSTLGFNHNPPKKTSLPPSFPSYPSSTTTTTAAASTNASTHRDTTGSTITTTTTTAAVNKKGGSINMSTKTKMPVTIPTTMSVTTPWARHFIKSRPNDALLPIPREFLSDGFNLVQLAPIVEYAVSQMFPSHSKQHAHTNNPNVITSTALPTAPASSTTAATAAATTTSNSFYRAGLKLILEESYHDYKSTAQPSQPHHHHHHQTLPLPQVQRAAEIIYTLVHARYISSPRGLDTVRRMFQQKIQNEPSTTNGNDMTDYTTGGGGLESSLPKPSSSSQSSSSSSIRVKPIFGKCSRVGCGGMPLLPCGDSDSFDVMGQGGLERRAKRFCPSCGGTFYMWESKVDGSAWGTSFCHLFLMTHGDEIFPQLKRGHQIQHALISQQTQTHLLLHRQHHHQHQRHVVQGNSVPRIFGFRIHPSANIKYPIYKE